MLSVIAKSILTVYPKQHCTNYQEEKIDSYHSQNHLQFQQATVNIKAYCCVMPSSWYLKCWLLGKLANVEQIFSLRLVVSLQPYSCLSCMLHWLAVICR